MPSPHLLTNKDELALIKKRLNTHNFYAEAFNFIKSSCDYMLKKGFEVPKLSGYVFYNTCKSDNTALTFDPYDKDNFICPTCGMNYKDQPFKRAWICQYHHWLSQMAIYQGICFAVTRDESYAGAVRSILLQYATLYPTYEYNDNELGSTRLFQSTYMESVFTSYLAFAYDLVCDAACFSAEDNSFIKRELFHASAMIIKDYDEKRNNRQAFNNSALCAVALLNEDDGLLDYALNGPHGFISHMSGSVLSDGMWYEGDNYHFATLPSIVNIAEVCLHGGMDFYNRSFNGHTIKDMYYAPLISLQPDLTFPSRKDSPYASLIAQRWYAGLYELAHTRCGDDAFGRMLNVMYENKPAPGKVLKNAAGVMDIFAPAIADRTRLDWRGFLTLTPELPDAHERPVTVSYNMKGTGLAVLRSGGDYLSLDYGDYGGGHGHPDRLAVTYFTRGRRWLTDYGTGQYYFDHLNWYRSTIGHNTINADGVTHQPVSGDCDIFAETKLTAASRGKIAGLYAGTDAERTCIILGEGLAFDMTIAKSEDTHRYHQVYHGFGELTLPCQTVDCELTGEQYRFLSDIKKGACDENYTCSFVTPDASLLIHGIGTPGTELVSARAYGPPSELPKLFPILIAERTGSTASFVHLLEDVPSGEMSKVKGFFADKDGVYHITLSDMEICVCIKDEGIWVCRYKDSKLISFESFSLKEIPGIVSYAFSLDRAVGYLVGGEWQLELPGQYGSVCLSDELSNADNVTINGKKAARISYQEGLLYSEVKTKELYSGFTNTVRFMLGNFTGKPYAYSIDSATISLPDSVRLVSDVKGSLSHGELKEIEIELHVQDGQGECECELGLTGEKWQFMLIPPVKAEEWLDYTGKEQCPVKIKVENRLDKDIDITLSFIDEPVTLKSSEHRIFSLGLNDSGVIAADGFMTLRYTLQAGSLTLDRSYTKKCLILSHEERLFPLDSKPLVPNIVLDSPDLVSRGEKRWSGKDDLSAVGSLYVSGETSLTLRLEVLDDTVCFSGGKFPYDNDSVMVYFDRRSPQYKHLGYATDGVYGLLLKPGMFGEAAMVSPLTSCVKKPEEVSLSIYETEKGYNLLADIPFSSLGGAPKKGEVWGFDLVLNDRDSGVRRDLQMIWSGALPDERIYLREGSHSPRRFGIICF